MDSRLAERVELIEQDDRHGASWLAREAVEAVCEAVQMGEDPIALAQRIVARPAGDGRDRRAPSDASSSPGEATSRSSRRRERSSKAASARGKAIAVLLSPHIQGTVMTHSNSATVREAIEHTPPDRVVCTVSEPGEEGRELAEALRGRELAVDLVDDSDAEHAVGTVDLLLLGADTVFRDGSLVNKVGTSGPRQGGEEGRRAGARRLRGDQARPRGSAQTRARTASTSPSPKHIDLFVTEEGEFPPLDIAALIDRTPFLHDGYQLLLAD